MCLSVWCIDVTKCVQLVHMGSTAVNHASVKTLPFAQMWMVSAFASLDGTVNNVNCDVTLDTTVNSVVRSVCV